MKNQIFNKFLSSCLSALLMLIMSPMSLAQDIKPDNIVGLPVSVDEIRWKSSTEVRSILGDPESVHGPVGTFSSYTMWRYPQFTVAFSNDRAFHIFAKDSLRQTRLIEDRP